MRRTDPDLARQYVRARCNLKDDEKIEDLNAKFGILRETGWVLWRSYLKTDEGKKFLRARLAEYGESRDYLRPGETLKQVKRRFLIRQYVDAIENLQPGETIEDVDKRFAPKMLDIDQRVGITRKTRDLWISDVKRERGEQDPGSWAKSVDRVRRYVHARENLQPGEDVKDINRQFGISPMLGDAWWNSEKRHPTGVPPGVKSFWIRRKNYFNARKEYVHARENLQRGEKIYDLNKRFGLSAQAGWVWWRDREMIKRLEIESSDPVFFPASGRADEITQRITRYAKARSREYRNGDQTSDAHPEAKDLEQPLSPAELERFNEFIRATKNIPRGLMHEISAKFGLNIDSAYAWRTLGRIMRGEDTRNRVIPSLSPEIKAQYVRAVENRSPGETIKDINERFKIKGSTQTYYLRKKRAASDSTMDPDHIAHYVQCVESRKPGESISDINTRFEITNVTGYMWLYTWLKQQGPSATLREQPMHWKECCGCKHQFPSSNFIRRSPKNMVKKAWLYKTCNQCSERKKERRRATKVKLSQNTSSFPNEAANDCLDGIRRSPSSSFAHHSLRLATSTPGMLTNQYCNMYTVRTYTERLTRRQQIPPYWSHTDILALGSPTEVCNVQHGWPWMPPRASVVSAGLRSICRTFKRFPVVW